MRTLLILCFLVLWTVPGMAQVDAEVILDQDQFLRDEPVTIRVRITNRSGQSLRLGEGNDWITFAVEAGGNPVPRLSPATVNTPFELGSAHAATREFNVQPWFDLSTPGRYSIGAAIKLKQWDREVSAKPKAFEITRGARLWEQEVGVPVASGLPETRRYILQQANYRKQLKLYVRVANQSDAFAYQVLPLGPLVSFGRPEAQVDEQSYLHVLFQTGARSFQYSVISPSGELTTRHTYDYTFNRPSLRMNEQSKIIVAGGSRRVSSTDLPSTSASLNKDVAPAAK